MTTPVALPMVVLVVMASVSCLWVITRPSVWVAWMANSMAASTVSSSKAPTVEEYRFRPAMRPGSSKSSIPICDTMPRSAASGPYSGHRTSTRRLSDRAYQRPWTASTQGPCGTGIAARRPGGRADALPRGVQFAVTVGEGDAGVVGAAHVVGGCEADEME